MEAWLQGFRMKVIDVNRINRGSRTGGIGRFSALSVVGNSDVSFPDLSSGEYDNKRGRESPRPFTLGSAFKTI